jgi:hypothetical protein
VELNMTPGASRETRQGRRSWTRHMSAAGAALALGAASLAMTVPAQGLDPANTGVADADGFPAHYTDNSGTSLQLCVDTTANCLGAVPADVSTAPDGEGFYWMATSTVSSPRGSIDLEFALEAAWIDVGQPTVFERTRVRGDLTPGKYTLLTPYGSTRLSAVGTGQRNVNLTQDLSCALPGPGCPPRLDNFLTSVSAPTGYLGDGSTATRVTGGTKRNELVLLNSKGAVIGRTGQFAVMGKLVDGPAAALSSHAVDFGNTAKVAHRSVGLKNQGTAQLSLQNISVAGANTIKVDPTGCAARASLAPGASCAVNLTYRPGKLKTSKATLVVNDNTIVGAHRVPVKAMTSSEFSARRAVSFKPVKVGSRSNTRRVVVTNTGVQPLRIKGIALNGSGARSFERRSGQAPVCAKGSVVKPRSSCALYVGFAPKTFGAKTANLSVRTNAVSSPDVVRLTGRGR